MKLFDNFEAVKFPEENLILITRNSYLYYNRFIYRTEYMMKVGKEKGFNLISFMGP